MSSSHSGSARVGSFLNSNVPTVEIGLVGYGLTSLTIAKVDLLVTGLGVAEAEPRLGHTGLSCVGDLGQWLDLH